jgi:peptidoglycan hydrolase CwlO-like protein
MSRLPTVLLALSLLSGIGWFMVPFEAPAYAATIDAYLSEHIAGLLFEWFGDWNGDGFETDRPTFSYTTTLLGVASLALAAAIGYLTGSHLRRSEFRTREDDLKRQLFEAKGRLPQLETSVRNRELAVTRLKMEIDEWQARVEGLNRAVHDRDQTLRDRDRSISKLTSEVAVLKAVTIGGDAQQATFGAVIIPEAADGDPFDVETLRRRLTEVETDLDGHQKRLSSADRERQRQDRWLEVLNDQLARARAENQRLLAGSAELDEARRRIQALEAEIAKLRGELADRDRRLAQSRFECANARTTVAYLQAELARRGDEPGARVTTH